MYGKEKAKSVRIYESALQELRDAVYEHHGRLRGTLRDEMTKAARKHAEDLREGEG